MLGHNKRHSILKITIAICIFNADCCYADDKTNEDVGLGSQYIIAIDLKSKILERDHSKIKDSKIYINQRIPPKQLKPQEEEDLFTNSEEAVSELR